MPIGAPRSPKRANFKAWFFPITLAMAAVLLLAASGEAGQDADHDHKTKMKVYRGTLRGNLTESDVVEIHCPAGWTMLQNAYDIDASIDGAGLDFIEASFQPVDGDPSAAVYARLKIAPEEDDGGHDDEFTVDYSITCLLQSTLKADGHDHPVNQTVRETSAELEPDKPYEGAMYCSPEQIATNLMTQIDQDKDYEHALRYAATDEESYNIMRYGFGGRPFNSQRQSTQRVARANLSLACLGGGTAVTEGHDHQFASHVADKQVQVAGRVTSGLRVRKRTTVKCEGSSWAVSPGYYPVGDSEFVLISARVKKKKIKFTYDLSAGGQVTLTALCMGRKTE